MSTTWFVPRSDLSTDQLRAVELPVKKHSLIVGAPGSGKTLVLLHRARQLIDDHGVPPERLRVLVYTNTLKDYIRSAVKLLDLPESCVTTFDHWCRGFHAAFIGQQVPFGSHGPNFNAIRRGVLEKLQGTRSLTVLPDSKYATDAEPPELQLPGGEDPPVSMLRDDFPELIADSIGCPLYDAVLVDEAQDLTPEVFDILKRVSRHLTMCMDARQQLYNHRWTEREIEGALGLGKRNLTMLGAYRCCPYITRLAASLLRDAAEREAFMNQARTEQRERLTPLLYMAPSVADEKMRVAQVIKDRQLTGDRIAVLLPTNAKLFSLARTLHEAGLEVEVPDKGWTDDFPTHDFLSERPKLMTYYGAKGLTFDTVIMPRLVPDSFLQSGPGRMDRLMFVGITRATNWVYMSAVEGPALPVVLEIAGLEKEGIVTVQRSGDHLPVFSVKRTAPNNRSPNTSDSLTNLF